MNTSLSSRSDAERPSDRTWPVASFDGLVHSPIPLRILSLLRPLESASFAFLREHLGVSDSVLSKHLAKLTQAQYARTTKITAPHRQTSVRMTESGRAAFDRHIAALRQLMTEAEARSDDARAADNGP